MPQLQTKPAPAKTNYSGSSWDDSLTDNLVILIQGQFGAGKTTAAATLSRFAPWPWPTVKHKGPPKHTLKDLYWMCFDKGALLSMKERGIAIPRFDVRQYMAEKKCSIMQATEVALQHAEKAVAAGAEWIVVDTVSTYDKALDKYWEKSLLADKDQSNQKSLNKLMEEIQIPKFGRMFSSHKMLHDNLMSFGCGVCYLTHSQAIVDLGLGNSDDREKQKRVRSTVQTASGGVLVPAITGKGAGVYKADARLQLVVNATKGAGGKLARTITADSTGGYETKNSWELSLTGAMEPNMRKIIEKIA